MSGNLQPEGRTEHAQLEGLLRRVTAEFEGYPANIEVVKTMRERILLAIETFISEGLLHCPYMIEDIVDRKNVIGFNITNILAPLPIKIRWSRY